MQNAKTRRQRVRACQKIRGTKRGHLLWQFSDTVDALENGQLKSSVTLYHDEKTWPQQFFGSNRNDIKMFIFHIQKETHENNEKIADDDVKGGNYQ